MEQPTTQRLHGCARYALTAENGTVFPRVRGMAQSRFSGESAGELTSIEAMAAAAEELAAGSEAATLPEHDLEPRRG